MNILRVILIVVIFLFMIFILFVGTENNIVLSKVEEQEKTVTCYAKEDIQRVEQLKCGVLLQALKIQIESECDCLEEIEEVENMYKEYIMRLEETCYHDHNSYSSLVY